MGHAPNLSKREKTLAIVAAALLIVFVVVGYVQAAESTATSGGTATTEPLPPSVAVPPPPPSPEPVSKDDSANQQRSLKDWLSYANDQGRELDEIRKATKGTVDMSVADGALAKRKACLNALQPFVGTSDFWDKSQECNDYSRIVEDELQDNLRWRRDCGNYLNNIKDRRNELKRNLGQQLKDIKRNDKTVDTSDLETRLANLDALITKFEQVATACNDADQVNNAKDIQRDIDDGFRDWYDAANEISEKANTARQSTENQKDFEKNLKRQCEKDQAREIKTLEKDLARAQKVGPLPADAQAAYDKVKELYNQVCVVQLGLLQDALTKGDMETFNDARNEFHNLNRDFWDLLNEARNGINQQQQVKDAFREMKDREKDFANMKKEYERAVKKSGGVEIPQAKQNLADLEALFVKAREAVAADPQSWWNDYQREISDLQNEFWESFQKVQQTVESQRWIKDLEGEVKWREKDLKNFKRDKGFDQSVLPELENLLTQMKGVIQKARELIASGEGESAHEALREMDDLRFQWDDLTRSAWEGQQAQFEMEEAKYQIEFAENVINEYRKSGKITDEQANICQGFVDIVKAKFSEWAGKKLDEDIEAFMEGLEDDVERECPFLLDIEPPRHDERFYEDFFEEHVQGGIDKDTAASILNKVSEDVVSQVVQRLLSDPTIIQNLLQVAGEKYKTNVAGTLEAASTFYDEAAQKELIAKKTQILELTQQLDALKNQVQIAQDKLKELQAIQDELAGYNFYGNAGNTIRDEVERFIEEAQSKGLSKQEIRARIEELTKKKDAAIAESRAAKVEAGIIPFGDTDDNVWYTKYVAPLAKFGIVKGKGDGKNFDPNGTVTIAEIATMAFRVSGDSEVRGDSELCSGKFTGHWANKFVAWAESKNLSIVAKCTDINRPALRWEVAQVLLETASGPIGRSDEVCFKDIKPTDQPTNSVACRAQAAGILKGTADGKANPYNKINRGEAATVVKQAAERLFNFKFEDFGGDERDERDEKMSRGRNSREDDDEDDDKFFEEEGDDEEERVSGKRSRCWWDNQCTDLMSAQLVTPEECEAAGGEGWGPDKNHCQSL